MVKKVLFVLTVLLSSTFIFNKVLIGKAREVAYKGDLMTGFGKGRGKRLDGSRRGGGGPFRDGRGPNTDCPLKNVNQDVDKIDQKERDDSGRVLKRDGSGPRRDGGGPFRDGRGPNTDCPLKNVNQDVDEIVQKERDDSGRALKRDGSGPNKDGKGPRDSNLGPKENCPKK